MKLIKIETGNFMCDGGALFGAAPKQLWNKIYPCNEENLCIMSMRSLLIDTGERVVLIDAGMGNKQSDKFYSIHGLTEKDALHESLRAAGYNARDITDVILTHLHFDHCGWCTHYDSNKKLQITFPNAKHWVSDKQWENYLTPNNREGDAYYKEDMMPVFEQGLLQIISKETTLSPEVKLKQFFGHTPGLIVPHITYNGSTLVFTGDLIPMAAFVSPKWVSAYDTYPVTVLQEKEEFLKEAHANNYILFYQHDYFTECSNVILNAKGKFTSGKPMSLNEVTQR